MPAVLNCRTIDTARESVAAILGMSVGELRRRLREIDVPQSEEPCDFIASKMSQTESGELPEPSRVHWFHASRVVDPESFKREGILTKAVMIERLRPLLKKLAVGLSHEGSYPNGLSVAAKTWFNDEGPFGFLIHGEAVSPDTHFFRAPESVEDIAGGLLGGNFLALVQRYQEVTMPCLVEFRAAGEARHVARALWYVHLVERGSDEADAADAAGTCFVGNGIAVPIADIVAVEVLASEVGRLRSSGRKAAPCG